MTIYLQSLAARRVPVASVRSARDGLRRGTVRLWAPPAGSPWWDPCLHGPADSPEELRSGGQSKARPGRGRHFSLDPSPAWARPVEWPSVTSLNSTDLRTPDFPSRPGQALSVWLNSQPSPTPAHPVLIPSCREPEAGFKG